MKLELDVYSNSNFWSSTKLKLLIPIKFQMNFNFHMQNKCMLSVSKIESNLWVTRFAILYKKHYESSKKVWGNRPFHCKWDKVRLLAGSLGQFLTMFLLPLRDIKFGQWQKDSFSLLHTTRPPEAKNDLQRRPKTYIQKTSGSIFGLCQWEDSPRTHCA